MPLAAFPKCFLKAMVTERTMSVDQWVELADAELDLDGLEFYSEFIPLGDPVELRRLRRLVEARGMSVPMLCVSPDFTKPDAAARQEEIARHRLAIDAAAELGAGFCRVLSGQRRPGLSRADGIRWSAECIRALLPHAERRRVVLNLENHYKDGAWSHPEFAQPSAIFLELLAQIPESEWFGVNFDPSNTLIGGEDPIALLEAVKHRVVTMHASDRYLEGGTMADLRRLEADAQSGYAKILRHGVIGRGLNDYDRIFAILHGIGFAGWISIEDGEDPAVGMEHLRESAVFLRAKMAAHALT